MTIAAAGNELVAATRSGQVRGLASGDMLVWRGIPYARAPVGPLRFAPPQDPVPWRGVRAATENGPVAWQPEPAGPAADPLPERSEDCLTVNVTRPAMPSADPAGYPVLVWVHGGGYVQGSGARGQVGDGASLARHGLVVVTFNYRLGCLGFLHLADAAGAEARDASAGQAGFLDQVAALRWVQASIAGFGGDPHRVTVYGVSAGAKSIANLIASPLTTGLVSRAISASGGAEHLAAPGQGTRLRRRLLSELGLADDLAALSRLRALPAHELAGAQQAIASGARGIWVWRPVLGAPGIPVLPITAIEAGAGAGIPMLIGHNGAEGATYQQQDASAAAQAAGVLSELFGPAAAARMLAAYRGARPGLDETGIGVAILGDERYGLPTHRLALAQSAHAPVWRYRYDGRPPGTPAGLAGGHGLDAAAVWRGDEFARDALAGPEAARARLSLAMGAAWARFACGEAPAGSPGGVLPGWPRFEPSREQTLILDDEPRIEDHPRDAEFAIWPQHVWPSGTWWPIPGL